MKNLNLIYFFDVSLTLSKDTEEHSSRHWETQQVKHQTSSTSLSFQERTNAWPHPSTADLILALALALDFFRIYLFLQQGPQKIA